VCVGGVHIFGVADNIYHPFCDDVEPHQWGEHLPEWSRALLVWVRDTFPCGSTVVGSTGLGARHFPMRIDGRWNESGRCLLSFCTFCTKGRQVVGEMSGCLLEILIQITIDIILPL
jgi:hypothetical protein